MTTALSTSFYLPDVMALEVGYVGRFAQGGGLDDLSREPYDIGRFQRAGCPMPTSRPPAARGRSWPRPTDIGPGTLLYRADVAGQGRRQRSRADPVLGQLRRRRRQDQGRHRRLPDGPCARHEGHRHPHRHPAGRGPVLRQAVARCWSPRRASCAPSSWRARCASNKLDAKVGAWSNEWSEGFKRGTIATQMTGAWLAGPPEQLARARHQGPVARGAVARRRLRGLRRHLLRHRRAARRRRTSRWPGSSSS